MTNDMTTKAITVLVPLVHTLNNLLAYSLDRIAWACLLHLKELAAQMKRFWALKCLIMAEPVEIKPSRPLQELDHSMEPR